MLIKHHIIIVTTSLALPTHPQEAQQIFHQQQQHCRYLIIIITISAILPVKHLEEI